MRYRAGRAKQLNIKGLFLSLLLTVGSIGAIGSVYKLSDRTVNAVTPPDSCFAFSSGTITEYYDNENDDALQAACPKNVDIPSTIGGETVTNIGIAAFYDKSLTAVTLPNTITTIETAGFDTNQLTEISIPDSVTTLQNSAFSNNQLTDIFIPNSVTYLDQSSFHINPLESVVIGTDDFTGTPELVIGGGYFNNIPTLTHVSLGKNVLQIDAAFRNNNISSLTLGSSITSIGASAFSDNQLTDLVIPNSVTYLGSGIASGNPLESLTIGTLDFSGVPELVIPNGMFYSTMPTLNSVTLGNNVLSIGSSAFYGNNISQLTLGDSIISIGSSAFANNQITELFIPNSVTSLGVGTVQGNPITSITVGTADFSGTPSLYLSGGSFTDLPTLTNINLGSNIVGIGSGSLQNNNLTSLVIPNSVVDLYPGIASGNPIQSITIGTSDFSGTPDTEIMSNAFGGIPTLSEVNLGENVTVINPVAFAGGAIEHVTIPASVTNISYQAFMDNPLKSVTILGNPTIQQNSFSYNLDLSTIPDGLTGEDLAQYYQDNADYVRMYATDPDFIAAHGPGLTNTETFGANTYVVSGYILNPATYAVDYESSLGEALAPQFTSGVGPTLADYSIAANPSADFSLYYTAGDDVTLQPLEITGYPTPAAFNLSLVAGANNHTFVYTADELADTGSNTSLLVSLGTVIVTVGSLVGIAALRSRS